MPAEHAEHGRRLLGLRPYTTPYEPSWLNRPADAPPYRGPMELYLVLPRDEVHIVYRHSRLHLLTTALTEISDDLHQERTLAPQASARRTRRLGNVGDVHHHARHTDHQQQRSGVISAAAGTVGTLAPAYPPGTDIEPGVEVLPAIPVDELSIAAPIPFVPTTRCANVPADVVTAAGLDPTPTLNETDTCGWRGSSLGVEIGGLTHTMADEVAEHVDMSTGKSEPLVHLAWLRIGDHYAIERILKFDRSASCWLSLDLSIPGIAFAVVYP